MKILVVTNFYPPHFIGGYELGCGDVVEGLRARGHQVQVLTSRYGVRSGDDPAGEGDVSRWLVTDYEVQDRDPSADVLGLMRKEVINRRVFKRCCKAMRPDLIYFWNLKHISISLALVAEQLGYPVCYFVSDYWLSEWENDSWYAQRHRQPKRAHRRLLWRVLRFFFERADLLSRSALRLDHVQFASHFLAQATARAGKQSKQAEVIHWGVDTRLLHNRQQPRSVKRLLYVGQLIANKGVQTAIEALRLLREQAEFEDMTLTIVGGPDYNGQIERLIHSLGLDKNVTLTGLLPRERLPLLYQEHGILLFPSLWDEPFSLTVLEAMASGLAVVGTATGGSPEVLQEGDNALLFAKGNAQDCAEKVKRLADDAALYTRIGRNARQTVAQHHTLDDMVSAIERSLKNVANRAEPETHRSPLNGWQQAGGER